MKVNNIFLSKIIQEEIKKALYEDEEEIEKKVNAAKRLQQIQSTSSNEDEEEVLRRLIDVFKDYRNILTKNPTDNKEMVTNVEKDIKAIAPNLTGPQILQMLDGKIDRQLLTFISNLLKRDKRMSSFSDKLDSYELSISPEEQNVYQVYNKQDPDPGFMRVPKDDEAYDQEDVRRDIKTLTKENKMKVTKEYLKRIITEEIKSIKENVEISSHYDQKIADVLGQVQMSPQDKQNYAEALNVLVAQHERGEPSNIIGVVKQAQQNGMKIDGQTLRRLLMNIVSSDSKTITRPNLRKQKLAPAPAPLPPPK